METRSRDLPRSGDVDEVLLSYPRVPVVLQSRARGPPVLVLGECPLVDNRTNAGIVEETGRDPWLSKTPWNEIHGPLAGRKAYLNVYSPQEPTTRRDSPPEPLSSRTRSSNGLGCLQGLWARRVRRPGRGPIGKIP